MELTQVQISEFISDMTKTQQGLHDVVEILLIAKEAFIPFY